MTKNRYTHEVTQFIHMTLPSERSLTAYVLAGVTGLLD